MCDPFSLTIPLLDGRPQPIADYRGKLLLIVNVASQCGLSPQYAGLEALYRRYHEAGLEILAFPCNQFGFQESGSAEEIAAFCSRNYGVTFPVFTKIDVNGPDTHPLYAHLKAEQPGFLGSEAIKWNFTKFLMSPDGQVVRRYAPTDTPEQIERDIVALLPTATQAREVMG
ncbi:MAG: glutathione peroxidase [Oscillochloridaceae bacterium umkhey_bin13]